MENKSILEAHDMEYNSQKDDLIMPEYGRNVQLLIQYAKQIEDKEFRQAFVEKVIDLMMQMHPQNKNVEDYRLKLWKHLFHIAEFDIEVDTPNGEIPVIADVRKIPDEVPYPKSEARFRHYGHHVQQLIREAIAMEEGPKRDGFTAVIASYMKLAYKTWNREHYVSDEVIKTDLESLSEGKLQLKDDVILDNLASTPMNNNRNNNRRSSKKNSGHTFNQNMNSGGHGHNNRGKRNYKRRK